jgi:uncharacterized protein (UPF0548 family)
MKIVRAAHPLTAASCRDWSTMPVNSPPSGPINATIDHYRAQIRVEPGPPAVAAFERLRERLFTYDIFPPWFVRSLICPPGHVTDGATIVQRVAVGPLALEMAVRVIAVWDRDDESGQEAGFRYATIAGHAERGVAGFAVRLDADGRLLVLLEARSRPGSRLTLMGRPVARSLQRAMTRAALRRLSNP